MSAFDGNNSSGRGVLLYVGALYDTYPLSLQEIRATHRLIVYGDGLPRSGYYTTDSMKSEASILEILKSEGGHFGLAEGADFSLNEHDGSFECLLKDDCMLKYFFNADNIDATRIPSSILESVTTLWLHGHTFPPSELAKLPNLKMVHAPPSIVELDSEAYWAAREQIGTVDPEERLLEFNARCLIPDVLFYTAEEGYQLRGVEGMTIMRSDAPFTFEVEEEGDEDEEDDGREEDDEEGEYDR